MQQDAQDDRDREPSARVPRFFQARTIAMKTMLSIPSTISSATKVA
jgi:hypothetical protein